MPSKGSNNQFPLSGIATCANRYIVVGASGNIGRALVSAARKSNCPILPTYTSRPIEGGIHFDLLRMDIAEAVPDLCANDVVFVLAFLSDQRWVFENKPLSYKFNVVNIPRVIEVALSRKAHVVFLSSEAVFGLHTATGWPECAATCPTTEYGRQKAAVEQIISEHPNTTIVRTGWNVGWDPNARCLVKTIFEQLMSQQALVARDNILTLTDINDTASGLLRIGRARPGGIIHLVNTPAIRRQHLADTIVAHSRFGQHMAYRVVSFADLPLIEPKVASSWLRASDISKPFTFDFRPPETVLLEKVSLLDTAWGKNA